MKTQKAFLMVVVIAVLFASTPFLARAQTVEQLRAQIAEVLQQIHALRAQLDPSIVATPTPILTSTQASGAAFNYSGCPDLQFNLERGDRDGNVAVEVTMLQRFLSQDPTIYPGQEVTGYFGPATERGVQRFQERHGIVAVGDYQSTGYGRVGPRTRWAIKNSCNTVVQVPVTTTYGSSATIAISNTVGNAPLSIVVTLRSEAPISCTSYELDWGDGSALIRKEAANSPCRVQDGFSQVFRHTYTNAGNYILRTRAGKVVLASLPLASQNIMVHTGSGTTDSGCFVTPSSGVAPHTVQANVLLGGNLCDGNLTYNVDWGDGSASPKIQCVDQNFHYERLSHVYISPAIYTARIQQSHPNATFEEEVCTVNVGTVGTSPTGNAVTNQCISWNDGCNTCTRSYPGAQALCTQQYCAQTGAPQCLQYFNTGVQSSSDSLTYRMINSSTYTVEFTARINTALSCNGGVYTINFGDSNKSEQPFPADFCQSFTRQVTHTYSQGGTYIATLLRDGIIINQFTVIVGSTSSASDTNVASVITAIENFIRSLFGSK